VRGQGSGIESGDDLMSKKRKSDPRAEYRASWQALWLVGRENPEVAAALRRFHAASIKVALYKPERDGMGAHSERPWHGHRGQDQVATG
jgi:hypothetical protein